MAALDDMSPHTSPATIGVRRANRLPLYLSGVVVGLFAIVVMLVAMDRAQNKEGLLTTPEAGAGSSMAVLKELSARRPEGIIPARPETNLDAPPLPGNSVSPVQIVRPLNAAPIQQEVKPVNDAESEQLRISKMRLLEQAAQAKTTIQFNMDTHYASSGTRDEMLSRIESAKHHASLAQGRDPSTIYNSKREMAQRVANAGGSGAGSFSSSTTSAGNLGKDYGQFDSNGAEDRWHLDSQVQAPSPFSLLAGFMVPATLISGINSDMPGQIMAQVSQDVYDTPTGKYNLIPQGSRLVGSYSSDVAYGQSRVLVAWQRIIFPDGKTLDIGSMPGADGAGYSGFNDKVNNHYVRLFGSAFLMSGIVAGVSLSQEQDNGDMYRVTASQAMSEALGQQLGQVTAQLITKNMNISPTLEIRPGYRFNVIVTKDMVFSKPYESFDY